MLGSKANFFSLSIAFSSLCIKYMPSISRMNLSLQHVAQKHDYKSVQTLTDMNADPNFIDGQGNTALLCALRSASVGLDETVQALLDSKANPNINCPLHHAAYGQQLDCIRLLLHAGADPCQMDNRGTSAIDISQWHQDTEAVELMMYWNA